MKIYLKEPSKIRIALEYVWGFTFLVLAYPFITAYYWWKGDTDAPTHDEE